MANIKSSQKKNRQRIKHQVRNTAHKTAMRTAVKRVRAALGEKDKKSAEAALKSAIGLIDRAAVRGVIKRRTAARSVSRLVTAVRRLGD